MKEKKLLETHKVEIKEHHPLEMKPLEVKIKDEIKDKSTPKTKPTYQAIKVEKSICEYFEIPDTIQVNKVLVPKIKHEYIFEGINSPSLIPQDVPVLIKSEPPTPASTITCSIDENPDTKCNILVTPPFGTVKTNMSPKMSPIAEQPILVQDSTVNSQLPLDFTSTFGLIDLSQPPPPGLEIEMKIVPKVLKNLKPRLLNNVDKLKEYCIPIRNKGNEMSGLCTIM